MTENEITQQIVDAALRVQTTLGPGLLESVYQAARPGRGGQGHRGTQSVETVAPVHKKQLLTHLKLADKRLGLLINFNVVLIKTGITRIVNGLKE